MNATDPQLTIAEWVAERLANCERIASKKTGQDQAGWLQDAAYFMAIQAQLGQRQEMLDALKAYAKLDDFHANCEECGERPEYAPEACEQCFPLADDARLKMRRALERVALYSCI